MEEHIINVADIAKKKIIQILKDLDLSIQFNCFLGTFEFVDYDSKLINSLKKAMDKSTTKHISKQNYLAD